MVFMITGTAPTCWLGWCRHGGRGDTDVMKGGAVEVAGAAP